ncbi:MAG: CDP-2,3-bis-(O-geranylgeranyl)-sn-glycerol synthase [Desulfurococcaceae archaeon]|jgi:CDP-2,3-bis-(O-geranylgeranyl)-sn-glycerol synthase|nr:CDP-2,3-bis-(O-geranylgeranyl)-sn-glycerol synthase [Desulfurococcaceae archaeon]
MDLIEEILSKILETLIIYFPSMAANGAPVLIKKGTPIDMNKRFIDGRRIFGDGKTFEGLGLFIIFGTAIGSIYTVYVNNIYFILYGLISGVGACVGDLLGAFIKRRLGIERGAPAPLLDQTNFLVLATIVIRLSGIEKYVNLHINIENYIIGVLLIPLIHLATNYGAYRLKLKKVPY